MTALHNLDQHGGKRGPGPLMLGICVFLLCLGYALRAGVVKTGEARWLDARWLYVGGLCWRNGESPYSRASFENHWRTVTSDDFAVPLANPPSIALVMVPASLLPWEQARWVLDGLNVGALLACLLFVGGLSDSVGRVDWRNPRLWMGMGACCLVSGVPGSLFLGQTTMLALAGTLGTMYFWKSGHLWASAACVVVASFKPQIAALPLLYMLMTGGHRQLLLGGVLTAIAFVGGLSLAPVDGVLNDIRTTLTEYQAFASNRPPNVTGMASLLSVIPVSVPPALFGALGVAVVGCVGLLARIRQGGDCVSSGSPGSSQRDNGDGYHDQPRPATELYKLTLPFAITGALVQLHAYDFVVYLPLIGAVVLGGSGRAAVWLLPGLALVARPGNVETALVWLTGASHNGLLAHLPSLGAAYILIVCLTRWRTQGPNHRSYKPVRRGSNPNSTEPGGVTRQTPGAVA